MVGSATNGNWQTAAGTTATVTTPLRIPIHLALDITDAPATVATTAGATLPNAASPSIRSPRPPQPMPSRLIIPMVTASNQNRMASSAWPMAISTVSILSLTTILRPIFSRIGYATLKRIFLPAMKPKLTGASCPDLEGSPNYSGARTPFGRLQHTTPMRTSVAGNMVALSSSPSGNWQLAWLRPGWMIEISADMPGLSFKVGPGMWRALSLIITQ